MLIRILAIVVALCAVARAGSGARVVLVDPDPELRRAVTTALAPWKLEVISDPDPAFDAATAAATADAKAARFVVWREGGELVVFDRESGESLRRGPTRTGTLDAVDAASAALTVKTLMRLPPEDTIVEPAPAHSHTEIRVQAGLGTRIAHGSETQTDERFSGAVLIRPLAALELRAGLAGDTGAARTIDHANFLGTWDDWSLLAIATWTFTRGSIEIEPLAGLGLERSVFHGVDNSGMGSAKRRDERESLAILRVGGWVRYRLGLWTVGAALSFDAIPGTPTYTKINNPAIIYGVPSTAFGLGLFAAADLGR